MVAVAGDGGPMPVTGGNGGRVGRAPVSGVVERAVISGRVEAGGVVAGKVENVLDDEVVLGGVVVGELHREVIH